MQNPELRPLGAGEMLDRAITLYVRRFAPIVAVLAVLAVPLAIVEAVASPQSAHAFTDFARLLGSAGDAATSRQVAAELARDNNASALSYGVLTAAAAVRLLMWCALVSVVASAYAGARTTIGGAYRLALRRWFPQLIVSLAFLVLGLFSSIPVLVLYVVVVIAVIGLGALHATVAMIAVAVVGGIAVVVALCTIGPLIFMAYELASVAVITETPSPLSAIGIGLRRALAPGMKRRTLVAGLVLMLVSQAGAVPLIGVAAFATALTHVDALYFAILGTGSILLDGIVAAFAVVYAVDARVRREGYDLILPDPPPAAA